MVKIAQIFTGSFTSAEDYSHLRDKVCTALDELGCDALIAGWNPAPAPYQVIIEEARRRQKEVYLWLPVFSEDWADYPSFPSLDIAGQPHKGVDAIETEALAFFCPSQKSNSDRICRIFSQYFAPMGFDGVFLDKIRSSSFANGFEAALGCFCPLCQEYYQQRGIDPRLILKQTRQNFLPAARTGAVYQFSTPLIQDFFTAKAALISRSVGNLCQWFRVKKMKVGLDVYAPAYAYYVGQDISSIASHANFIKPMMYRITQAPAGIPYEHKHLTQELGDTQGILEACWDMDTPQGFEGLKNQMNALNGLACPVYAGFEANYADPICLNTPDYLAQNLKDFKALNASGLVFSWNILNADLKVLAAIWKEAFGG